MQLNAIMQPRTQQHAQPKKQEERRSMQTQPPADGFLKGRSRIQDGDKTLASLGTTQRTASWILSLLLQCPLLKSALLGKDEVGCKKEPLIII